MTTALQVRSSSEMSVVGGTGLANSAQQYLSFMLAGEEYGVDILQVQELRGWESPTLLPNAPSHVQGVVNLRGVIVPILDLRAVLGMSNTQYSASTVVIILHFDYENRTRVLGVVVDAVSEVFAVETSQIKSAPEFGSKIDSRFIAGLAKINQKTIILLKAERLLEDRCFAN